MITVEDLFLWGLMALFHWPVLALEVFLTNKKAGFGFAVRVAVSVSLVQQAIFFNAAILLGEFAAELIFLASFLLSVLLVSSFLERYAFRVLARFWTFFTMTYEELMAMSPQRFSLHDWALKTRQAFDFTGMEQPEEREMQPKSSLLGFIVRQLFGGGVHPTWDSGEVVNQAKPAHPVVVVVVAGVLFAVVFGVNVLLGSNLAASPLWVGLGAVATAHTLGVASRLVMASFQLNGIDLGNLSAFMTVVIIGAMLGFAVGGLVAGAVSFVLLLVVLLLGGATGWGVGMVVYARKLLQ